MWIAAVALAWTLAAGGMPGRAEPFPLEITSLTPLFRTNSVGPEFVVTFVNAGPRPIAVAEIADAVFIVGGVRSGPVRFVWSPEPRRDRGPEGDGS